MRNRLPLYCGAALLLSAAYPVAVHGDARPHGPAKNAALAPPLVLTSLDLSSYGIPVVVQAPAGATVTRSEDAASPAVTVYAPNFGLRVASTPDYTGRDAQMEAVSAKQQAIAGDERHVFVLNRPLAYRMHNTLTGPDEAKLYLPDLGRLRYYTVETVVALQKENARVASDYSKSAMDGICQAIFASRLASPGAVVPATTEVSLDAGYNVPLAIKVPAGSGGQRAAVNDDDAPHINLRGPYYALGIVLCDGDIATAKARFMQLKSNTKAMPGFSKAVVDEPNAFRFHHADGKLEDQFAVFVADPATKHGFIVSKIYSDTASVFSPAQIDAMYAAARTARPLVATAPSAPDKKLPPLEDITEVVARPYKAR